MKSFGLFSGIGGFEYSLANHGISCAGLCEINPAAQGVLRHRFPDVPLHGDIIDLKKLPAVDVLTAGFPCQDLSQAGTKAGIRGHRSKLVDHVFRLIASSRKKPEWVLLENVSYMLRLDRGNALRYVLRKAEEHGYSWAYRTLDARAFGLPQRRERVMIVLALSEDPSHVLFPDAYIEPRVNDIVGPVDRRSLYGFYWTEGKRGLGWAKDAVPTIKGGSGLGIPSPPAIWSPKLGRFGTPSICDAERMFGFEPDWTSEAQQIGFREGARWHLVGNTICVPMVDWTIEQIQSPRGMGAEKFELKSSDRLPSAGFGSRRKRYGVIASTWPQKTKSQKLSTFLNYEMKPLSLRAASGFYRRTTESTAIRFADGFLESLREYIASIDRNAATA
ncbi:DNA cytosine methyltransferase [Luteimonas salinilitoris]|uniref:Cytosine-specific methyltransferase n=1 Tax=Luteimonas salinilitoris TaxID=3237697 RepID=A0ABV4HPG2_9GAMM